MQEYLEIGCEKTQSTLAVKVKNDLQVRSSCKQTDGPVTTNAAAI